MPIAFWGQWDFEIPEDVYFPADDTHLLLEYARNRISPQETSLICELGCGSGIIGVSLALIFPQSQFFLADISPKAIETARANAIRHNVQDRITFLVSNLFEKFPQDIKFDWILFNPPYLPASGELGALEFQQQTEGGPSGLEITQQFLEKLPHFLQRTGNALFIASSWSSPINLQSFCAEKHLYLKRKKSIHIFFEDIILFEVGFLK